MMWHHGMEQKQAQDDEVHPRSLQEARRREVIDSEARRMEQVAANFATAGTGTLGEAVKKAYEDMALALRLLNDARGT